MSASQAKALAKQAAADAKLRAVHEAAMQLLIDLKLPTAALSHPALVRLYEGQGCHITTFLEIQGFYFIWPILNKLISSPLRAFNRSPINSVN